MDDYLSEKEQLEQIKLWWRENGWYLVGGVLLAVVGYFGYQQYGAYRDRVGEEAAAVYVELKQLLDDDDREGADSLFARLQSDHPQSPYTDQARLLFAEAYLIRDTRRSIAELEAVVDQSRDEGLVNIARLRLARVLAYDEQYDRALEVLDVGESGQFTARFNEIRGDVLAARGDTDAAQLAYTEAMLSSGTQSLNRDLLQLKLNDLLPAETPVNEEAESASGETASEAPSATPSEAPSETPSGTPPTGPDTEAVE